MNTAEQNTKQCMEESDVIKQFRRLFPNDAIGIWVRTGKSIEEWLKIKGFKAWWGSSRWVVNPNFFVFGCR